MLSIECPRWVDAIPADKELEYKAIVELEEENVRQLANELIDIEKVKQIHRRLCTTIVPLAVYAGNFRGNEHRCLNTGVHVDGVAGSLPAHVLRDMTRLISDLTQQINELNLRWPRATNQERAGLTSKVIAWFIGSFIRIHPFINANGRTSRLLWRWILNYWGVPAQVGTHPRPNPPYDVIMKHSMAGDDKHLRKFILTHMRQCFKDRASGEN